MIQAPNAQYMPVQTTSYQQGAPVPAQPQMPGTTYSTPGVIYNYPTANYYTPTQPYSTDKAQYNGVNIEILNPQGQGLTPQNGVQTAPYVMPAQYVPVQNQPIMMPPYYPTSQAIVYPPQTPAVQPQMPQGQIPAQPIPAQPVPAQPIPAQPVPEQPVPAPQIQQPEGTQQPTQPAAPVVEEAQAPDPSKTPESFAGKLRTDDLDAQKAAIEEIAEAVKKDDTLGPVLLDTQIFDALIDIINKDTSKLEGPTPEVIELRQKPKEELTEEELTKASTPSPLEAAEMNKQCALYTISYMQERLNNELEKRNGQALELKDLPCIENAIDAAKENPNPMIRVGALAALSHIARPEYKEDLGKIFELAKSDEDARVQAAAAKALELLNGNAAPEEQQKAA